MYDLRKSCERCTLLKRKCDGATPCSRCVRKGVDGGCTYTKRRVRTCAPYGKRASSMQAAGAAKLGARHDGSEHVVMKRYRFSASPATGLVGMQENVFLSNFFGSVGFLPLTTRRDVREVMVTLMISPSLQQSPATRDYGIAEVVETIVSEDKVGNTWEAGDLPSTCTFWCAVAIGALAEGHPIESTASYVRLAKESMARYSGPTDFAVAKAWTILGYLHAFSGDLDGFYEYLALSDSFVHNSEQRGTRDLLPVGFPEVVKHGETVKLFTGTAQADEVESLLAQDVSLPRIREFATEAQISRYVMQSYRAFEVNIHRAMRNHRGGCKGGDGVETTDDGSSKRRGVGGGFNSGHPPSMPPTRPENCLRVLVGMQSRLTEFMPGFGHLEDVAERPQVRSGTGSLIINGNLVFATALSGDSSGAIEKLGRCVEVMDRYPGLTRFMMGEHIAHILLSMATSIDDSRASGLYAKLRKACNLTRPPGSLAFPPLEEWQGISAFCDNPPCRMMEALFAGRNFDFSSMVSSEGGAGTSGAEPVRGSDDRTRNDAREQHEEVVAHAAAQAAQVLVSTTPCRAHLTDEGAQDEVIAAEDWLDVAHATLESPEKKETGW